MNPKVSIIIPCYKSEKYIRQCVESILAQTYHDWEAIFVIDGPHCDNTIGIIRNVAMLGWCGSTEDIVVDPRIRIITTDVKSNPATARNKGVSLTRGEYIAFLDADDWWYPEKQEIQVSLLNEYPGIEWCYAFATMHKGLKTFDCNSQWLNPKADEMIPFQTIMIRRTLVDKIIKECGYLFDESLRQIDDYDLFMRIKKYKHVCIQMPLSHYRIHGGGLTTSSSRMEVIKTQLGINIERRQYQDLPRMFYLYADYQVRDWLLPLKNRVAKFIYQNQITLQVEPTTRCNLHCTKCSFGNDHVTKSYQRTQTPHNCITGIGGAVHASIFRDDM
jgi:glycosyltransferase involved in cell wall biosynthesis